MSSVRIEGPAPIEPAAAQAILRSLPEWFGIEAALLDYARAAARLPTFAALAGGETIGFLSLREHFAATAEIDCIAVARAHRHGGVGRALLGAAEHWWRGQGGRLLQVKTIGPSHPDPNYAQTRRFYESCGFVPVEEFAALWSPRHPCLLLVKPLGAAPAS